MVVAAKVGERSVEECTRIWSAHSNDNDEDGDDGDDDDEDDDDDDEDDDDDDDNDDDGGWWWWWWWWWWWREESHYPGGWDAVRPRILSSKGGIPPEPLLRLQRENINDEKIN